MVRCFLPLSPSSRHAWIKFATKVPASLLFLGRLDLTHVWTSSGRVFRNCSSTSSSIICSLVWVSGCSHWQQSSQIWLTARWGPVTDRDWKCINFSWEIFRTPGFLIGMASGSCIQKSWGFLKISKMFVMCAIFTAWSFAGRRYLKRQAAPEHTVVEDLYQRKKEHRNLWTCRNYTERLINALHN